MSQSTVSMRFCVVCEVAVGRRETTCGGVACLAKWQQWRAEAAARLERAAPGQSRTKDKCRECGAWTWGAQGRGGLCASCQATALGYTRDKLRAATRPSRAKAARCPRCSKVVFNAESRAGLCLACHDEERRACPRACEVCRQPMLGQHHNQRYCSAACRESQRRAARRRTAGAPPWMRATQFAQQPSCSTCEHGRVSRTSETGYLCGIQAAMRCRPSGPANLYVYWEDNTP